MEGKELSKFLNLELIDIQIRFTFAVLFLFLIFKLFYFNVYKKENPDKLRINVNSAEFEELITVPYIGMKNADRILKIRDERGVITDLKQLKNLRYYKKFKYFLKVE